MLWDPACSRGQVLVIDDVWGHGVQPAAGCGYWMRQMLQCGRSVLSSDLSSMWLHGQLYSHAWVMAW